MLPKEPLPAQLVVPRGRSYYHLRAPRVDFSFGRLALKQKGRLPIGCVRACVRRAGSRRLPAPHGDGSPQQQHGVCDKYAMLLE